MGYTLRIGELDIDYDQEDSYIRLTCESKELPTAPAFGEPTDHSNSRWPSYTSWSDFVEWAGINELFYDEDEGLIREHPGCVPINKKHQAIINEAYDAIKDKYPNVKAGYSPKIDYANRIFKDPDWPIENSMMTRLEWLKFWFDWALDNCNKPVFYNS